MHRRELLRAGTALAGGITLSGCLESLGFQKQSAWRDPPLVKNRPDAVYYPAYVEEMGMYGITTDGDYRFALTYSFPHRFWNLTGQTSNKVTVQSNDSLHLMVSLWDPKSEIVLPANVHVKLKKDGKIVDSRSPWPMLSQNMGSHYGDNVSLDGEGQYTATIEASPLQIKQTGSFASRFTEPSSVNISFNFDTDDVYNLEFRQLGKKQGNRGAIKPMMEKVPPGRAPPQKSLPGRVIGTKSSGDADFVVTLITGENRFTGNNAPYLAVSPRTPYNKIALPRMSLSIKQIRNGSTLSTSTLAAGLDPELEVHYGTALKEVRTGDTFQIQVDSPPQLARHDGYETAFMNMPPVKFTV
ncbi:iron transporter [Haladaptatus sp. DYF46]|uniref:iron transporter n=1 Tax=Haladaptatus sp. DYF46 TaxID=2886041 RepID=UPI001E326AD3|nr:iron transporter [Haladaptatus sp. DYF46]